MNNSDEGNIEESKSTQNVLTNQNKNDDIDNNNIQFLPQQSNKHSIYPSMSKVRKVYKHLSNQKTNAIEGHSTTSNSVCINIKNSTVALGKGNNKTKNNVKSSTSNPTNNKITKHKKYTKKDNIITFRKKLKSPPMPDSIKNIKIKEVYPDHWNCVYCSKEITYNDIYDHSTTCIHIDTDQYGKHLICCICKYATMKLSNLRKHIWTHTGEKPFKCSKCSYNSTQSSNLRMHLKIKHSIVD
uniref:Transcriptional repressor CTCFL n=2 Tax=Cacopsylla melanoneura TaxID=428564 RepID=A0A8D9AXI8_9HEMI